MLKQQEILVSIKWLFLLVCFILLSLSTIFIPKEIQTIFQQAPMIHVDSFSQFGSWVSQLFAVMTENRGNFFFWYFIIGRFFAFSYLLGWSILHFQSKTYLIELAKLNGIQRSKMYLYLIADLFTVLVLLALMHMNLVWPYLVHLQDFITNWFYS
ncbi:hypothetical protein HCJ58_14545 [Listeria sp. FSL L7-1509]|uniref:Uncharacterized protein n=2 Tax=Listeria immobilis TaxID=2713502 RepID=A0ABR6SZV2_9LIST|nr:MULTISPECIES: hypothetical protein [Listeria]MBC1484003.1 hypothetical protein [Listeria immobilis]MBC1508173.1 hypothetical protein [Listeria immobilis]MBC1511164.1 hypothetical protein [Listeria immobilis]MBC1839531.1 hypothetical protein [Listeria seeligeri]MBC6313679.1 hypothetical protein [Listeria immobilis]